ncbi:type IV secretion system DNA-binding domain-containing protein [Kosakonia radicincitans]|uniref:type IV secretion system DNA-binding domain-containing protein n=1 Tax=Kosakonia radicincitans TaxID=283686 RepID=UPI0008CD8F1B|nr:type IV secretion system DNA-binding domain-containing protein [Kosakonia radicincitans]SET70889.1 AAA-like domain-containing protein [Kosakonia radicincitans]
MNKIVGKLNAFAVFFSDCMIWVQGACVLFAIAAGVMLPFILALPPEKRKTAPFWLKCITAFSLFSLTFGTFSPLSFWILARYFPRISGDDLFSPALWIMLMICTGAGLAVHMILRRLLTPELEKLRQKTIRKTDFERDVRTDVRNVRDLLPKTMKYNPLDYIDLAKGIFIGLDEAEQPQYIPVSDWQKQHADLIGTTGAGKGVAAAILLYQSILADEAVFVMDPKDDEWAPHLYREACRIAKKPFALIDLRKSQYQLDLLDGVDAETLEELLNAGFSLAEKGEAADFYRIGDRRASRHVAGMYEPGKTLRDLFNTDFVAGLEEDVKNFHGKMEEISILNSVNAKGGLKFQKSFDTGGCVYVIGSMRNPKIISAQRMILVRLLQIAESRDRIHSKPRPIAIFLDELKYHLSRAALEGLGAARDKGVHIIMAHQSIADLKDCPADLKGDSVVGAVVENTKFKLVYKLQDPETADWVARMTGSILVDDESRQIVTDAVLVERVEGKRTIRQAERYYVDTNMLLNLPENVSFIFTSKTLPRASMIAHIPVEKKELIIYQSAVKEQTEIKPVIDWGEENVTDIKTPDVPEFAEAEENETPSDSAAVKPSTSDFIDDEDFAIFSAPDIKEEIKHE